MADFIANGESGASVRAKLNSLNFRQIAEPLLPVSPKFFVPLTSTTISIMTPKAGGVGGVLLSYVKNNVDADTSESLGGSQETWRGTSRRELLGAALFKTTVAAESGTWTEASLSQTVAGFAAAAAVAKYPSGVTAQGSPRYWHTTTQNDYRDYAITADADGGFNVGFVLTSDGGTVEVSDTLTAAVIATVDLARKGSTDQLLVKRFNYKPGAYSVRLKLTSASATKLSVAGVQYHLLGDRSMVLSNVYDSYAYWRSANDYTASSAVGAVDYAFRDSTANRWGGSFHGGETILNSEQTWFFDGASAAPQTTLYRAVRDLRLEQRSLVDWTALGGGTLELRATTSFRGDGSVELTATGAGTDLTVGWAYTAMHTTDLAFTEVYLPAYASITSDGNYAQGQTNAIIQRNPTTGQRVGTFFSVQGGDSSYYFGPRVQRNASAGWVKPYYGPVVSNAAAINDPTNTVALSALAWRTLTTYE